MESEVREIEVEPTGPEPDEPRVEEDAIDPGMMTFGILGYVTLDEADEYVKSYYRASDELRTSWDSLAPEDKAALLRKSFQSIETLPFSGRKYDCSQPTAFPRWPTTDVPFNIKAAQIEQALISSDGESSEDARHYEKLWQWGVSSYTIGNLSESLSTGTYGAGALRTAGISSATSSRLLAPYIQGGFNIR